MSSPMIRRLEAYLEADPDDSFTRFALAMEYRKVGDTARALGLLVGIQAEDPGYVGTYYHLGKLYEELGEPDQARATYRTGLAVAGEAGDQHAGSELQEALMTISDD